MRSLFRKLFFFKNPAYRIWGAICSFSTPSTWKQRRYRWHSDGCAKTLWTTAVLRRACCRAADFSWSEFHHTFPASTMLAAIRPVSFCVHFWVKLLRWRARAVRQRSSQLRRSLSWRPTSSSLLTTNSRHCNPYQFHFRLADVLEAVYWELFLFTVWISTQNLHSIS
jgi:hypothetical protein